MAKEKTGNNLEQEIASLKKENEELKEKNHELEETLDAIRSGEVDAIVVSKGDGQAIYTLEGADTPYRVLIENIREGALTLSRTGMILYANTRFSEMVKVPAEKIAGTSIFNYICPEYTAEMEEALREILKNACRSRLRIRRGEKGSLPVLISMNPLDHGDDTKISAIITDRRKDEARILLQARMLDAVGDAVIAADMNNKIIYWNEAATKTYGWEPEEAVGHDLIDVATPDISKKEAREIAARLRKGETWTGEYIVRHRDGHEFPIYASDAPVFDDDGKLIAIIGASHDITERKRVEDELKRKHQDLNEAYEEITSIEEELRQTNEDLNTSNSSLIQSQEELRLANREVNEEKKKVTRERDWIKNLLDIAGAIFLALDTKGHVILINRRGSMILGRPEEEILGRDWITDFLPARIQEDLKSAFPRVMSGEIKDYLHYENPILTRDGEERSILWNNSLIKDADGRITGILSSGEDITELKQTEMALRAREKQFRSVLDNSLDIIYRLNISTGQYEYVSPSSAKVVGYSADELKALDSETAFAMIHPDDLPAMKAALADMEENGHAKAIYRQRTKTGEYRWLSNHLSLVSDDYGGPVYRDGTIRDITEMRNAEEKLKKINDDLNALNEELITTQGELQKNLDELTQRGKDLSKALEEKEVLLSEVHHRVKNNLAAFISLLSLDGSYEETQAGRGLKKDLQNRARTMALIHETLYQTGQYSEVNMEVYLNTLVRQVVDSYSIKPPIRIVVEANGITLDLARATPTGLIINELVTNSIKYAFPQDAVASKNASISPSTIKVLMTREDGTYLLKVSDNGKGFPENFDLKTTQTLGLKLVNFLAGHQLRAKPEINKENGTEFIFRFKV